jgi:glutamate dehydrogenase (NAD(P)+)
MARYATAPAPRRQESLLDTAMVNFRRAAAHLQLGDDIRTVLSTPMRELQVEIPLRLDNGTLKVFHGYRVQHNGTRGPVSGGLRFDPNSHLDAMRGLAATNTWKAAVLNLPFGGAQGAIACDPATLSKKELERLTRKYISRIHLVLGPYRDVTCPDMATDSEVMGWIFDQFSSAHGYTPACATGKPTTMGGSPASGRAAGSGVAIILREAARDLNMPLAGLRVAIQGLGTVACNTAAALQQMGCRIIAVSDSRGGIRNKHGLDIAALLEHVLIQGTLTGFRGAERIDNDALLTSVCDVLIPAATDSVLTAVNASRVRAKLIIEGANLPTTASADAVFEKLGITVVPDILANGGGMASSYFEWTQNLQQIYWDEERLNQELEKVLTQAYATVSARAEADKVPLRVAAYSVGIERVARVENLRPI